MTTQYRMVRFNNICSIREVHFNDDGLVKDMSDALVMEWDIASTSSDRLMERVNEALHSEVLELTESNTLADFMYSWTKYRQHSSK